MRARVGHTDKALALPLGEHVCDARMYTRRFRQSNNRSLPLFHLLPLTLKAEPIQPCVSLYHSRIVTLRAFIQLHLSRIYLCELIHTLTSQASHLF